MKTHRYFTGTGWSEDLAEAKSFGNELAAATACVHAGLYDLELVIVEPMNNVELFSVQVR